MIIGIS